MKTNTQQFQDLLQKFFLQRLINQKNVTPDTVKSYRDTFRLYFRYLDAIHHLAPHKITLRQIEADFILNFLDYLKSTRNNKPQTINNRLAAIHSFLHFLSFEIPEYSAKLQKGLLIPYKKQHRQDIDFLSKDEITAILAVCDGTGKLGRRDKLMILLLYNTGIRVSELLSLRGRDVIFDSSQAAAYIQVMGKGRKERRVPLWKNTASFLKTYLYDQCILPEHKLFLNYCENELTRSGVRYRLQNLITQAKKSAPTLDGKNITPHTFRHSTALHLLQAGIDLSSIALVLGHESLETTHKYLRADMKMKQEILNKITEPPFESAIYKPTSDIIDFLSKL